MNDAGPEPQWCVLPEEEELALIARELRAHVAWQATCGTEGLPRDPDLSRKLERLKRSLNQQLERDQAARPVHQGSTPSRNPSERLPQSQTRAASSSGARSLRSRADNGVAPHAKAVSGETAVPRSPERSLEVLGADLDELQSLVAACTRCPLHETRTQTVFSRGTGSSGLCFVGEGPGAEEDAQGAPFVGAAGKLLDDMITAMGFSREEVYVCSVVKCRPPNDRKPDDAEIKACGQYLSRQLELLRPEVVVALGGTAVEGLLGLRQGITKIRGKFRLYDGRIAVMPTFHPAYLLQNGDAKKEVWADLRQVVQYMGRSIPPKS